MPTLRVFRTILCIGVFLGTSIGLNNGMVLCFDEDGRLAIEAAHVEHAHRHADGEDHGDHELGLNAAHQALHDSIASCFDTYMGKARQHSSRGHVLQLGQPLDGTPLISAAPDLSPSAVLARWGTSHVVGGTARSQLACLNTIVLLV